MNREPGTGNLRWPMVPGAVLAAGLHLGRALVSVLGLSLWVFLLLRVVPGDVAAAVVGRDADLTSPVTQDHLDRVRVVLDLDRSLPEQYRLWVSGPLRGDLGRGLWHDVAVFDEIRLAFLKTAELLLLAAVVAAALGVPLGLLWGRRRGGPVGGVLGLVALVALSTPAFWTGTMLFLLTLLWFGWAPNLDYRGLNREPWQNLQLYLLPSLALGLQMAGAVMRAVCWRRSGIMADGAAAIAALAAPQPGLGARIARWVGMLLPAGAWLPELVGSLLGGAVLLEVIFSIPGLGWLMARAAAERDLPTLQWLVLLLGVLCWLAPGRGDWPAVRGQGHPVAVSGGLAAALGLALVVGVAVAALAGPSLIPYEPSQMDVPHRLLPPVAAHPLGTDEFGRDLLSRLFHGARVSLATGVLAAVLASAGGALVGRLGGWQTGWAANLVKVPLESLGIFPPLVLALAVVSLVERTPVTVALVVALVLAPMIARLPAGSNGVTGGPAAAGRLAALAAIGAVAVAQAILLEAHLSFLGLGPSAQGLTWGSMLAMEEQRLFEAAPWLAVVPGLAISVTVLAFNLLADGLAGRRAGGR